MATKYAPPTSSSSCSFYLTAYPRLTNVVVSPQAVVVTNPSDHALLKKVAAHCHANGIKLVIASTRGLAAFIFCDFGPSFIVTDPTGEEAQHYIISSVTNVRTRP